MPEAERRILLFGAGGQLGQELTRALGALGPVIALDRTAADFSTPESLRAVVRRVGPAIVANAAAYTAVDRAESEPELAYAVNAEAPRVLAEESEAAGAVFVHYSTDYVFDGQKENPYVEEDAANPLSVYGRSKLDGETAIRRVSRRHLIFRTSWVMGAHGANFLKTILRLAAERDSLRVVADQIGAPTPARLIAETTRDVLGTLRLAPTDDERWGLYHLTSSGETSWHAYARYIVEQGGHLGVPLRASPESVVPIATMDYSSAAPRPANSRLSSAKLRHAFGVTLPDWRRGVDLVLHELHSRRT